MTGVGLRQRDRSRRDVVSTEELLERFARTRDPDDRAELIDRHRQAAARLASRFIGKGEPGDDLQQVAVIGLIQAVDRFDPSQGNEFASFLVPTVLGEIRRYFRDHAWSMRVPRRVQENYLDTKSAVDRLTHRLGRSPTMQELGHELGMSEELVVEALEAGRNFYSLPLDMPTTEGGPNSGSAAGSMIDDNYEVVDSRDLIRSLTSGLPAQTRLILHLRFNEGLTQSEIGKELGVSQMFVSRTLAKVLARLREAALSRTQ